MPNEELRSYVHEKLEYQIALEKLEAAGESDRRTQLTQSERQVLNKDGSLRTRKVNLLNNVIFPSMANLLFFFESVAKYPQLQKVFDSDIRDLVGINRQIQNGKLPPYADTFSRLITAMVDLENSARVSEERDYKNFRIRLIDELANIVVHAFQHNLSDDFTLDAQQIMMKDVFIAQVWTQSLARIVPTTPSTPTRIIAHQGLDT